MSRTFCSNVLVAFAALCGCDAQVDRSHQGDSLLRIEGSVAIPVALAGEELVPAIAFRSVSGEQPECEGVAPQPDHLRLIEVGVEGDFPSRFTLDVFDPPPQEAMSASKDGELSIAVGYVTAVRKDHPAAILTSPIDEDTYDSWRRSDVDDCEEGVAQGETCLVQHACTLDAERCLHRALACTSSDQGFIQFNECELLGARGDESLTIAGYSVNYWVVFFSEPVAGGTPVANWYADGKPITAGYHLYRIEQTEALDRETLDCFLNASTDAVDRYNAEHGSELTLSDFAIGAHPEREVERAYSCIRSQVLQEADCSVPIRFEEVTGSIAIELGALTGFDYR